MASRGARGLAALVSAALRDPKRLVRWASSLVGEARSGGVAAVRRRVKRGTGAYQEWVARYDTLDDDDRNAIAARVEHLEHRPTISVLMPVYDVAERWLREAIESVLAQIYPDWELCIADDASPSPHVRRVLEEYADRDRRVRVVFRETNGHISAASNSALELARGAFVALLDHDDLLAPHALAMVALELDAHRDADLIYSDEDGVDDSGERFKPMFKPDVAPELLLSVNCVSHLGVYRTAIVREVGGFRVGFEGSQDLDLALRLLDRTTLDRVRHIPHILYHWRAIEGSVQTGGGAKEYAHDAARRAIAEHLARNGVTANVARGFRRLHRVTIELPVPAPLVTIVIVGDETAAIATTLASLAATTGYDPFEIVVASGGAHLDATSGTRSLAAVVGTRAAAVDAARGDVVVFVRAGHVAEEPYWLHDLVAHALRDGVGAVGGRIVDRQGRIIHAGIALDSDGKPVELYRGLPIDEPGELYRAQLLGNYSACSAALLAARRALLIESGAPGPPDDVDAGVELCARLHARGRRIVWTPHSQLVATTDVAAARVVGRWKEGGLVDPMLSPNLVVDAGMPVLARPPRTRLRA